MRTLAQFIFRLLFFVCALVSSPTFAADIGCGKDTDRSGAVDNMCPGGDTDNDGYTVATGDCDDANAKIFPGMTTASGCSAGEYRTCAEAGTGYTSCSTISSSTCSSGSGTTYWIDCDAGSDGTGTFASPWYDFKHISYYYQSGDRPAGWHDIAAGDCIRVKGTCNDTVQPSGLYGYGQKIMEVVNEAGTSTDPIRITRWPGASTATLTSSSVTKLLYLEQTQYVYVSQLHFTGATTVGVSVNGWSLGTNANRIFGNTFTAIVGDCDNNAAAISLSDDSGDIVENNEIWDMHVGHTGNSENCTTITGFSGSGVSATIKNNSAVVISSDATGYAFKWKRTNLSAPTSSVVFLNNIVGLSGVAFSSAKSNTTISNNYISAPSGAAATCFRIADLGGDAANTNVLIDNNTCIAGDGQFLSANPTWSYGVSPSNWQITDNVFYSTKASALNGEASMLIVSRYANNTEYTNFIGADVLTVNNNCYYNTNAQSMIFSVFGDNGTYNLGEEVTLATWQAENRAGGNDRWAMDTNSVIENPSFSASVATSTNCTGKGWQFSSSGGGGSSGGGSFRFRRMWR